MGCILDQQFIVANAIQVRLAANSCVTKDINQPGDYGGFPAVRVLLLCSLESCLFQRNEIIGY